MTEPKLPFFHVPLYRGKGLSPIAFALIDRDLYPLSMMFRWLIRPGTNTGFRARTFIDDKPLGLHQLVYIWNVHPNSRQMLENLTSGPTTEFFKLQNLCPRMSFKNLNGLDCRFENLTFVQRVFPQIGFPSDDPVMEPQEIIPEPNEIVIPSPQTDVEKKLFDFLNKDIEQ